MALDTDKIPDSPLEQCQHELALVLEIDRLRDRNARDPQAMLSAVTETATKALAADVGLLALLDKSSESIWYAQIDPTGMLPSLDPEALSQAVRAAAALHTASPLDPGPALEAGGIRHLLAAPLVLNGERFGSLVFLSADRLFSQQETALLAVAASQIDSAVLQFQTWSQLENHVQEIRERNRQLDAIYRIDRIRDETDNINQFLMQVADLLSEVLDVDLCLVGLIDQETNQIDLRAVNDRINVLRTLDQTEVKAVFERTAQLTIPQIVPAESSLAARQVRHALLAPLSVNEMPLGAVVLGNQERAFSATDLDLVKAVVSQADSAVAHLHMCRQAQERAQQIEAIYRVDQVRDQAQSEPEILSAVADLLTNTLGVDLCLMSLINEETGKSELRAIEDRQGIFGQLGREALEATIRWAVEPKDIVIQNENSPLSRWQLQYMMGSPLIVNGERLGALILASSRRPFGRSERELLHAVVSQTDSAIVHSRVQRHLKQRNLELETLYRVDQIRDQGYDFGAMLSAVLGELCAAIDAEMGFIMLFDSDARQLELKASTADDILSSAGHYDLIEQAANEALRSGKMYAAHQLSPWLHSIMCVPLILQEHIIGVFGAVNRRGLGRFTGDDKRLLTAITSQVDTAIFESLDKERIRNTFRRYVGPNVMEQMLATPEKDWLKGDRAELSVLFSDMRGFTSMSERVDVDLLVEMINMHLGAMTDVVLSYDGTLDKFVADEVMAIFGAPLSMPDHALRAIKTALGMQAAQQRLIEEWKGRGGVLPPIGIGINTGEMVVGNIGCVQQMDYTVLGSVVNLASRLCDAALGNQILISDETYRSVADAVRVEKLPQIHVKGKEEPVSIYQVLGLK